MAHYPGAWRLAPGQAAAPGWFEGAEFRYENDRLRLLMGNTARAGVAPDVLEAVNLRGSVERIEFIEVRLRGRGRQRILRFTASETDADGVDLNEIQYPLGDPKAMQAKSYLLERGVCMTLAPRRRTRSGSPYHTGCSHPGSTGPHCA